MKMQEALDKILKEHSLWLGSGGKEGTRANLYRANLSEANLYRANLSEVSLCRAKLYGANLRGANLREAKLYGADLREANLRGANLRGADLGEAGLRGADLGEADLRGANLYGANLYEASLYGADLRGATLPHFKICPEEGGFYAWKKTTRGVIKIYIPAEAKRVSSLVGRKCRAEFVEVICGLGCGGSSPTHSDHPSLRYEKGAIVYAHRFDDDIRIECAPGIHFFMTKQEAEEW